MNLYFISQTENNDYDTYDSAVVAAESEEQARKIHPGGGLIDDSKQPPAYVHGSWCQRDKVTVELIGQAKEGIEVSVICASFNAG